MIGNIRSTQNESSDTLQDKVYSQKTYLVFEAAILLLFSTCFSRHQAGAEIQKAVIGFFLRVTQLCKCCGNRYKWGSQPHIRTTRAGNVLISSAILFTGLLPANALQIFKVLNYASITRSTYFFGIRHTSYSQPCGLYGDANRLLYWIH